MIEWEYDSAATPSTIIAPSTFKVPVTIPESQTATPIGYRQIAAKVVEMSEEAKIQFAQIKADLANLRGQVDGMAAALITLGTSSELEPKLPPSIEVLTATLGTDFANPAWATLLDRVADAELNTHYMPAVLNGALAAPRPSVRAAAARAIAVLDRPRALRLLPALIEKETNRVAAGIMKAALAAAQL